jgi:hypothetical protein
MKWIFPSGTTLAPGGAQLVWCNGGRPASATHTGFGLEQRGGAVFLFNAAAGGGGLLDAIQYGLQTPDFSIARLPDGAGSWGLAVPTPGATNQATLLASESALSFNEWMADPVTGDDWLELHNRAAQPVALGGLLLTDDLADPGRSPIAPLSYVGVGVNAFVQFIADGNTDAGANHLGFSLRKTGEALGIFTATGVLLDGLSFGAQQPGVSEGRFPDGAAARRFFTVAPSPGRSNVADPGESDRDGDGMDDAWELSHFGTLGRDGTGDFDLDLMSDREEFVAGTHPGVAADRLGFLSVSGGGPTILQFRGVRGRSYTVRFRDSLVAGAWVRLMDVELRPADGVVTVVDPDSAGGQRFYQLVTPALVGQ